MPKRLPHLGLTNTSIQGPTHIPEMGDPKIELRPEEKRSMDKSFFANWKL